MKMVYEEAAGTPRTRRKRTAKRAKILDAALRLVAAEGLEALTVTRLAEALDYTAGALYRYFPSKDALVAELEGRALADIGERFAADRAEWERAEQLAGAPPAERELFRLLAVARLYVDLLDELPEQVKLISAMLGDQRRLVDDANLPRVAPTFVALMAGVTGLFRDAIAAGALSAADAGACAIVYWSSLQGIVQVQKLTVFDAALFDPSRRGPELSRALLLGWGADPAALDRAGDMLAEWRNQWSSRLS